MDTSDNLFIAPAPAAKAPGLVNSTEATLGQPMVERVQARQQELSTLLADVPETNERLRAEITLALDGASQLLSGDLENVPAVVLADMNNWLERAKHVDETAVAEPPAVACVPDEG